MGIGAREVYQEAQAAVANDIEFKEVPRARHFATQAQNDGEKRQVEQEFVERRGLAAHSILGDGPGQIARQAERITAEQVTEPPYSLSQG